MECLWQVSEILGSTVVTVHGVQIKCPVSVISIWRVCWDRRYPYLDGSKVSRRVHVEAVCNNTYGIQSHTLDVVKIVDQALPCTSAVCFRSEITGLCGREVGKSETISSNFVDTADLSEFCWTRGRSHAGENRDGRKGKGFHCVSEVR